MAGLLLLFMPHVQRSDLLVLILKLTHLKTVVLLEFQALQHVLILTAIVVGVATLALGLALVVRINEAYGSIEEDDVHLQELQE